MCLSFCGSNRKNCDLILPTFIFSYNLIKRMDRAQATFEAVEKEIKRLYVSLAILQQKVDDTYAAFHSRLDTHKIELRNQISETIMDQVTYLSNLALKTKEVDDLKVCDFGNYNLAAENGDSEEYDDSVRFYDNVDMMCL